MQEARFSEEELAAALDRVMQDIELVDEFDDVATTVRATSTFADVGMLTMNAGLVIELDDGSEFQLTIVRSR